LSVATSIRSIAVDRATGKLLRQVRACDLCAAFLPAGPRPVLQVHADARILIAGQAPGSKVHKTGIPFDDASGDRLRDWMGIDKAIFYDPTLIAMLPMGFCYPGTGKSGDLPPRPECAAKWRARLLARMPSIELTLVIGKYALDWHLKDAAGVNLTETVRAWRDHWPHILPLPHPSPRNNIWLKRNGWFEEEVLPSLKKRVRKVLRGVEAAARSK
jgi:uracil-DNA glycosylase